MVQVQIINSVDVCTTVGTGINLLPCIIYYQIEVQSAHLYGVQFHALRCLHGE